MTRCPNCFVNLSSSRHAFRCTSPTCSGQAEHAVGQFSPTSGSRGPLTFSPTPAVSVACSACRAQATMPACPKCGYDLPPGWRDVATTCLVMAGARTSGKSVYIAVLKKEAESLATMLGGTFDYASALTKLTFEQYYERYIFVDRDLIPPTPSVSLGAFQREPLVFALGTINNKRHFLVLRDVAGEDLENQAATSAEFDFTSFADADAIIFIFDPMMVRAISAQLTGIVRAPTQQRLEPVQVLVNLVRLMRGDQSMSTERFKTPLALVLGKFDTLHELQRVQGSDWGPVVTNIGAAINRDPSLDSAEYDDLDGELLEAEVSGMLVQLGAQPLLNYANSVFSTVRLFAVSALGAPPSMANDINPRGLAPFRVLDPLRWAMNKNGYLAIRTYSYGE